MNPQLHECIEKIIDGKTYGNPEKIIHWTTQSLMSIAGALHKKYGIKVSHTVVAGELEKMGYSKQMNQKMLQVGKAHKENRGIRSEQYSPVVAAHWKGNISKGKAPLHQL